MGGIYMKKFLALLLLTIIIIIPFTNANGKVLSPTQFNLNCKSSLLMEYSTGNIIYENNSHEKLAPASVTKVMTMLLAMEAVDNGQIKLNDKATISARAKSMGGSTMYLETGELRTVEELIKGVSIESANDAAVALGEFVGGSEEAFIERMNARAKELGMKDTNFVNPTGFYDANHYTSAHDIALMSRELLKHSKILNYTTIWMETISEGRKEPFTLVNRNKMIKGYPGCDGLKTGFITESKYCISSTAKRGDIRFISVIMGAPSWKERNEMAGKLLDYGFSKFESVKLAKKGEVIDEIKLPKCKPDLVKILAKEDLNVIYEKGNKVNIEKKVQINSNLKLPLKKGDSIGFIEAVDGNKVLNKIDVIVDSNIKKINFFDSIGKAFKSWLKVK
jgi:D-alanyl-D-alanine carboxypeptidase (penicillin-binding protein 5/6)